eukprot:2870908-Amphidinium_carterae.1
MPLPMCSIRPSGTRCWAELARKKQSLRCHAFVANHFFGLFGPPQRIAAFVSRERIFGGPLPQTYPSNLNRLPVDIVKDGALYMFRVCVDVVSLGVMVLVLR